MASPIGQPVWSATERGQVLLASGNEINTVSYWLGHADINTTHVYIKLDMDMKRKMLDKAEPPRVKKTSQMAQARHPRMAQQPR